MTQPPSTPPSSPSPGGPVNPVEAVNMPGTFLMVGGALYLVGGIIGILRMVLGLGLGAMAGEGAGSMAFSGITGAIGIALAFILGGAMIFGGMKMKQLQSYNIAMAGAVAGMVPCTCCCVLGLPIGIWALIVLLKPEVKAAFTG